MKYFTLATGDPPPKRSRWGRICRHSYSDDPILVFGTDDESALSRDCLEQIGMDPIIAEIMITPFIVQYLRSDQIIVHQYTDLIPYPDTAAIDTAPVLLCLPGGGRTVCTALSTRELYDTCLSLFRALGCAKCPDWGAACVEQVYSQEVARVVAKLTSTPHFEDVKNKLLNRKTIIAEFLYISPMLTRVSESGDHFAPYARSYGEHDFSCVEGWSRLRSEANVTAAANKKFKKTHCVRCPLQESRRCRYEHRHRYCRGAFPPGEQITAQLLQEFEEFVAASELERWQFMALARGAGSEGAIGRRWCILDGIVRTYKGLEVHAHRNRTHATLEKRWPLTKLDYENIAVYFQLPLTEEDARIRYPEEPTDLAKALWAASLHADCLAAERRGWGSHYDEIAYRKLTSYGIEMSPRGPTRVRHYRSSRVTSWVAYANAVGDPPTDQERAPGRY